MLVLPIAQRNGAPPQGEHDGEQPARFAVGDRGAEGLKVGVKNTFIDVHEAETPASRGAQTAMARICGERGVSFTPEAESAFATADPQGYNGHHRPHTLSREDRQGSWVTETPMHIGQKDYTRTASTVSPSVAGASVISIADGEVKFDTSSPGFSTQGLIPPPPTAQAPYSGPPAVPPYAVGHPGHMSYAVSPVVGPPMTSAPSSPSTFSAGRSPVPAPPAYAAPVTFKDQTSQPPLEEAVGFDREFRHEYNVKNTFVDVQDDATPMGNLWRLPQTCQARFSGDEAGLAFGPVGGDVFGAQAAAVPRPPSTGVSPTAQVPGAPPGYPASPGGGAGSPASPDSLASPSVGSAEHGKTGPDGQPVCMPCAWFYKDSGCKNGQTCRYCHLCPNGELKNRKKMKIQRLRNQDESTPKGTPKSQQ